jgi:hypothetical protein
LTFILTGAIVGTVDVTNNDDPMFWLTGAP